MFEVQTGKLLFTLDEEVSTFSPDGTMMATGDGKGRINLRKADTGELLRPLADQKSFANNLAFSPDGRLLASVQRDHAIYLWDVATGRLLRSFTGIPYVQSVTFLPDSRMLLSISDVVRFWGIPPQ